MSTLYITRGFPASGKTTYARDLCEQSNGQIVRVNRDDFRTMLFGGWTGEHHDETLVTRTHAEAVRAALKAGRSVICDDMHLRRKYVRNMWELATQCNAQFVLLDHFMDTPLDELLKRNESRPMPVPNEQIVKFYKQFGPGKVDLSFMDEDLKPVSERYIANLELPPAILVDIDGTVALHDGIRDPYDTSMYHMDRVNYPVVDVIDSFIGGHNQMFDRVHVIFLSGRHEDFKYETQQWLEDCMPFSFDELIMRDDDREHPMRDDVMKLSLFDRFVRDRYNVLAVFDDRNRVVEAWRSIGLTVFQVAEGDF